MNEDGLSTRNNGWDQLPSLLGHLPEPVHLNVWCDSEGSFEEKEAIRLIGDLVAQFDAIEARFLPRRANYSFYPVIGIMGFGGKEIVDFGLRIIGLPVGYQMTSLITAIQTIAFKGMTSKPITRIQLARLEHQITLELVTDAEDEGGPVMAHQIFNMAFVSPYVKSFLIMGDQFPEAFIRYSVKYVPHIAINERIHIEGVVEEKKLLEEMAKAVQQ